MDQIHKHLNRLQQLNAEVRRETKALHDAIENYLDHLNSLVEPYIHAAKNLEGRE